MRVLVVAAATALISSLSVANQLRALDKEVLIVEDSHQFHACPFDADYPVECVIVLDKTIEPPMDAPTLSKRMYKITEQIAQADYG